MLDWLIIGGGIHGTYLSHYLCHRVGVRRDCLRVIDPFETPLAQWNHATQNAGMQFLRSGRIHHLELKRAHLLEYARRQGGAVAGARFRGGAMRPALDLFQAHARDVIHRHDLEALRLLGRVRGVKPFSGGWSVETAQGDIEARRVILAIGAGERPVWPQWAQTLRAIGGEIDHIFDADFERADIPDQGRTLVIGGGITAAQAALALAARNPGGVTLVTRSPLHVYKYDFDYCWLTTVCHDALREIPDYTRRREFIRRTHCRGSLPQDVAQSLYQALGNGSLKRSSGEVIQTTVRQEKSVSQICLTLDHADTTLTADRVLLATGFDLSRPGGDAVDALVTEQKLACAECGYPITSERLEWGKGLFVTGPLSELEVGPMARNIAGARIAAHRIATAI